MVANISNNITAISPVLAKKVGQTQNVNNTNLTVNYTTNPIPVSSKNIINQPRTSLNQSEKEKYIFVLDIVKNCTQSANSPDLLPFGQLDYLLKNGKLLSKSTHDNSTVLDNLYEIATTERAFGLDKATLITNALDLLCNPRFVTQTFGDIPSEIQPKVVAGLKQENPVKNNPDSMNVYTSGTCAAASIEVNMADKYPAEFARWVNKLSSKDMKMDLNVDLKAISKNPIYANEIITLLEAKRDGFGFDKAKITVEIDDNVLARANVQTKYWDKGERNVADVLIQSAIMKLGSQNTYNALNDVRAGKFNSNPQGLIELEKTFVESLIKNKEITSLVYQKIDDNQNLVGYNCSMGKIASHITQTIDEGDDVILGYVLTNETSGMINAQGYNEQADGPKNKVINGHEITVVDYYKDEKGQLVFICIDTDDDSSELVQYSADWLLPKIHHAGYPAHIVETDEKEIMKDVM